MECIRLAAAGIPGLAQPDVGHQLQVFLDCAGYKTAAALHPLALLQDAFALAACW